MESKPDSSGGNVKATGEPTSAAPGGSSAPPPSPSPANTPQADKNDSATLDRSAGVTIIRGKGQAVSGGAAENFPEIAGYKVTGRLGEGGMGVVWRAEQLGTHRQVALKLLGTASFASTRAKARFEREVELAARLDHPGIARVYESGVHQGVYYYAMELIDAGSPVDRFAEKAMLSRADRIALVREIALAVQHAHQRGVIHRDLKPGNILVTPDGKPHVLDFGLAKASMNDAAGRTISLSGEIAGTPAYMSPEQAAGRTEELDTRSDVYSLGVILYELLTGAQPHDMTGGHLEIFRRISEDDIRPARSVDKTIDRELDAVLLKAMSHLPADRYESAGALAHDLTNYLEGNPLAARAPTLGYLLRKRAWKQRRPIAAVLALLIAAMVVVAVVMHFVGQSRLNQRIVTFNAALRQAVERDRWASDELASLDGMIAELRAYRADEDADRATKQVNDALAASIEASVRSPRMSEELARQVRSRIASLAVRTPAAAEQLSQQLSKRVRSWERVFELRSDKAKDYSGQLLIAGEAAWALGNTRCEVILASNWEEATLLQVSIRNASDARDRPPVYSFTLTPCESPLEFRPPPDSKFKSLSPDQGVVMVQVSRQLTTCLRTAVIPISSLRGRELRLVAQREGDRVSLQINDMPEIAALDIEPAQVRGPMILSMPSDAVRSVLLFRQPLPPEAGPLDRADHLFSEGKHAEAIEAYDEVVRTSRDRAHVAEARYKWAVTALRLNRRDEAGAALGEVFGSDVKRWPLLAGCQLAVMWRNEKRDSESTMMMEAVISRFPPGELAENLIDDTRHQLLDRMRREVQSVDLIVRFNSETIPRLERMLQMEEAFATNPSQINEVRRSLLRAYEMQGRNEDALRVLEKYASEKQPFGELLYMWQEPCETYGRLARLAGRPAAALSYVEKAIKSSDGAIKPGFAGLLVESARCRLSLGDPSGAMRDLDVLEGMSRRINERIGMRGIVLAALLRGILLEEAGKRDEAIRVWKSGFTECLLAAADKQNPSNHEAAVKRISGTELIALAMLGSLSDSLTEPVARAIFHQIYEFHIGGAGLLAMRGEIGKITMPIMQNMWHSRRGREFVGKFAKGSITLPEMADVMPLLAVHEFLLPDQDASTPLGTVREQAFWEVAPETSRMLIAGKINSAQVVSLLLAWKGMTTGPGWSSVVSNVPPAARGPLSYYLGIRYLRLGRAGDAKAFFSAAIADAAPESPLRRAVDAELRALEASPSSAPATAPASRGL